MEFEVDLTNDPAFFKQNFRNANALRITDLDDLGFHNYIVITRLILVNLGRYLKKIFATDLMPWLIKIC